MQNAKCKMQNAKCKMQNAKCKISFWEKLSKVGQWFETNQNLSIVCVFLTEFFKVRLI